jgi:hypothetical protein
MIYKKQGWYCVYVLVFVVFPLCCSVAKVPDFVVPNRAEIIIVANHPQGSAIISSECYIPVDPERILSFFSGGSKVYISDVELFNFSDRGTLTLPKNLPAAIEREVDTIKKEYKEVKNLHLGAKVHVEGALLTSDYKVYFWRLYSDHVLLLWNEKNNKRVLVNQGSIGVKSQNMTNPSRTE